MTVSRLDGRGGFSEWKSSAQSEDDDNDSSKNGFVKLRGHLVVKIKKSRPSLTQCSFAILRPRMDASELRKWLRWWTQRVCATWHDPFHTWARTRLNTLCDESVSTGLRESAEASSALSSSCSSSLRNARLRAEWTLLRLTACLLLSACFCLSACVWSVGSCCVCVWGIKGRGEHWGKERGTSIGRMTMTKWRETGQCLNTEVWKQQVH